MKVILCSFYKFPCGDAGAIRHEKIAQMLHGMGHEVLVVGIGQSNNCLIENYKGINYTSLRFGEAKFIDKVITRFLYWRRFKAIANKYKPDCILMDDMRPFVTVMLKNFCMKKKVLLVHDSVEWYSPEQFKLGYLSPSLIQKGILNRLLIDKKCRVIAISKYLKNYYSSKGIKCVNMPIVVSDEDIVEEKHLDKFVNLCYAGQAGKKDYLHIMLNALALLSAEERQKIKFHIIGCTIEQITDGGVFPSTLDAVMTSLVIYGRVPREKVLSVLKSIDFIVLMRSEEQRYAKAGFPTKVVEGLSHSTAVIANITSDLGNYLVDGYNSLIVPNCSAESLADALRRAISLSPEQRKSMCRNACMTAREEFHMSKYMSEIQKVLE